MPEDLKLAAVKTAGGALIYGLTLNEWVAVLTGIYFAMQIGLLVPKYWRLLSDWFRGVKQCPLP